MSAIVQFYSHSGNTARLVLLHHSLLNCPQLFRKTCCLYLRVTTKALFFKHQTRVGSIIRILLITITKNPTFSNTSQLLCAENIKLELQMLSL